MCMTTITFRASPRPESKRPGRKRVFRWKRITYSPLLIGKRGTYRGYEPVGTWQRAHRSRYSPSDPADVGFHTYKSRRDARASTYFGEVTRVEVSGLIASGLGDGSGNEIPVETWLWIRVPLLKKGRE